jgi:hypothetical protein
VLNDGLLRTAKLRVAKNLAKNGLEGQNELL